MSLARVIDPTDLVGSWELRRTIDDRVAGTTGTVTGETTISSDHSDRLRWSESGVMRWQDRRVLVTRVLYLLRDGDGGESGAGEATRCGWSVTFDDGRDFHPWATGEPVEHRCGADLYRGGIDVDVEMSEVQRWRVWWDVSGPAKDYTLRSVLTRGEQP